MELAALIIAFAAFGAAAASAVIAWFQRADALAAATRAERSEVAAQQSAASAVDAYRRTAQSLEALAFLSGPPWELRHLKNYGFLLTNNSPLPALEVELNHDASGGASLSEFVGPQTIGPRSAVQFIFIGSLATGFQKNLIVTWKREGSDEVLRWVHPFPPRTA